MTIETMEALEAIPVGNLVRLRSDRAGTKVFTRSEKGFDIDGVTVEPKWFAGHVAAGELTDYTNADPEVGDYFRSGQYGYLILRVADGTVWGGRFRQQTGGWIDLQHWSLERARGHGWVRVSESDYPEWYPTALSLGGMFMTERVTVTSVKEDHTMLQAAYDLQSAELAQLKALRVSTICVTVRGVAALPPSKAAGKVPEGATVTGVTASWEYVYTVASSPGVGCMCGTVTRADVAEMVGADVAFTYEVDCGRH